jgi:hypothetical protein
MAANTLTNTLAVKFFSLSIQQLSSCSVLMKISNMLALQTVALEANVNIVRFARAKKTRHHEIEIHKI